MNSDSDWTETEDRMFSETTAAGGTGGGERAQVTMVTGRGSTDCFVVVAAAAAAGLFDLVVGPGEGWEVLVVDGEVLRLLAGRLGYHADWERNTQTEGSTAGSPAAQRGGGGGRFSP